MDDGVQSSSARDPDVEDLTITQDDPSSTHLDLTSYQLHDLDSVELPTHLTELDLTSNRLSSLDPRIAHLSHLKKLSLRQNLITDAALEPLSAWHTISALEVLSLLVFSFPIALPFVSFTRMVPTKYAIALSVPLWCFVSRCGCCSRMPL